MNNQNTAPKTQEFSWGVNGEEFARALGESALRPGANELYGTELPGPTTRASEFLLVSA